MAGPGHRDPEVGLLSVLLRLQGTSGGLSAGAIMLSFYFIFRPLCSAGRAFL